VPQPNQPPAQLGTGQVDHRLPEISQRAVHRAAVKRMMNPDERFGDDVFRRGQVADQQHGQPK
jgi:hypothetical protein